MHKDEEATHVKLTSIVANVVNPAIAKHGGRIVKNTGDGFLAAFLSAPLARFAQRLNSKAVLMN